MFVCVLVNLPLCPIIISRSTVVFFLCRKTYKCYRSKSKSPECCNPFIDYDDDIDDGADKIILMANSFSNSAETIEHYLKRDGGSERVTDDEKKRTVWIAEGKKVHLLHYIEGASMDSVYVLVVFWLMRLDQPSVAFKREKNGFLFIKAINTVHVPLMRLCVLGVLLLPYCLYPRYHMPLQCCNAILCSAKL